jgi:hypothetical protein
LRKGRIAAETLKKPLTFFEAVETLKLPKHDEASEGKKKQPGDKKVKELVFEPHHKI